MFKICSIGCGNMARSGHGPAFKKYAETYPDTQLAACCDLKIENAESFKEQFGFKKSYTDYKLMLNEIKPDAVCLISPVDKTVDIATQILEMGYPLILEKPPGRNKKEVKKLISAAKESGVTVRVAFNRRYTPLLAALKEFTKNEVVRNITYQMYRKDRRDDDFSTTTIHAIDAVKFIADCDYKTVDFTYQQIDGENKNVANIYLNGIFESGAIAQLSLVAMGGTVAERISVNTDVATYFVELPFWSNPDSPGKLTRIVGNDVTDIITGDTLVDTTEMFLESGFYEENRSFFDAVRAGNNTEDVSTALQSVEIADCIRKRKTKYTAK